MDVSCRRNRGAVRVRPPDHLIYLNRYYLLYFYHPLFSKMSIVMLNRNVFLFPCRRNQGALWVRPADHLPQTVGRAAGLQRCHGQETQPRDR